MYKRQIPFRPITKDNVDAYLEGGVEAISGDDAETKEEATEETPEEKTEEKAAEEEAAE